MLLLTTSVDDSLGLEVKLCDKVMVLCEKTPSRGVLSYSNIFQFSLLPPLSASESLTAVKILLKMKDTEKRIPKY